MTNNEWQFTNLEKWKDIKGYESVYQISNFGRVKRLEKRIKKIGHHNQKVVLWKGRVLKRLLNPNGYFGVDLSLNGKIHRYLVHRLVLQAFLKNPKNKPYINHKNLIKTDNNLTNLEWVTPAENDAHAIRMGVKSGFLKGEKHLLVKLTEKQVLLIRANSYKKLKVLAEEFKVNYRTISDILTRKRWKHI